MRPQPVISEFMTAQRLLSRITYKPSWTLTIECSPDGPILVGSWQVEADSTGSISLIPGDTLAISGKVMVPFSVLTNEHAFFEWVRVAVRGWERHESDEWFKLDGIPMHNPHAPLSSSD